LWFGHERRTGVEKTKTMEESTLNSRSRETEVLGRKKDTKVRVPT